LASRDAGRPEHRQQGGAAGYQYLQAARKPAGCTKQPEPIALWAIRRYIPSQHQSVFQAKWMPVRVKKNASKYKVVSGHVPQIRDTMRAEVERLVEEIKQVCRAG